MREVDRRHGGRAQVAVTRGGRVVAAASSGPTTRPFRMWSVGKVATAVALLERGGTLQADVRRAIEDALVGSGNCAQRQLMVELQRRAGGIEPARRALARVLRRAGVRHANLAVGDGLQPHGLQPLPGERLDARAPPGPALQTGTATWRLSDAARFAFALDGLPVADLLRRAKRHAPDDGVGTSDVTGDLGWGAGVALERPASPRTRPAGAAARGTLHLRAGDPRARPRHRGHVRAARPARRTTTRTARARRRPARSPARAPPAARPPLELPACQRPSSSARCAKSPCWWPAASRPRRCSPRPPSRPRGSAACGAGAVVRFDRARRGDRRALGPRPGLGAARRG